MDRRPPLALSPRRLRPRSYRAADAAGRPPVACSFQTPAGSIKKAQTPLRSSICALPTPRLEPSPRAKLDFTAPPSPARAAGKENRHVHDEVSLDLAAAAMISCKAAPPTSPLFERGRLYDLYTARRNERLKRKHGFPVGEEEAKAMAADPCVAVELSKRRGAKKTGTESVRRSMPVAADFSARRTATTTLGLRSSLRSSKEMKKVSAASFAAVKSSAVKERRASSTRSSARKF
ncbi:hypothetical protein GUJ93_ZPchr0007g4630 [Zizania palustris]|uniref:Uncharacterized protein n=1 Tax=Zizania palustris TaxID=103762 RepID=A0A8J5SU96_ZIZPA|nr:hypothetical protein GUJ93_ZPchr0007g4630 [Zizania palustris]